ncbi:hypothetical protein [Pseudomonas sp. AP-1]|uniref:hypothetical protein n=1 Tax=Pseudomonas sp. AP-1 TaxID=3231718 RepID=UPI0035AF4346
MKSQTTTSTMCTAPQLARLAGVTPQCITQRLDRLPPSTFGQREDGKGGRPPKAWTLDQLAELVIKRTAGWTDLELRVRAALLTPRPAEGEDMANPLPNLRAIAGSLYLVPTRDGVDRPDEAPEHERLAIEAALAQERQLDAERCAAARARSRARKSKVTN